MTISQSIRGLVAAIAAGPALMGATAGAGAQAGLRTGFVLVANQQSANVSLIDLRTDSAVFVPVGDGPHEAVIAPSGRTGIVTVYGIAGAPGNKLAVLDVAARRVTKTIDLGEYTRPHGAIFLPGETRVVVTSETTQRLLVVNLENATVEKAIATGAAALHMVALSGDGTRAWTANFTPGSVSEIDLPTGAFVRTIAVAPGVEGIAITPDGRTAFVTLAADPSVAIVDLATMTVSRKVGVGTAPDCVWCGRSP